MLLSTLRLMTGWGVMSSAGVLCKGRDCMQGGAAECGEGPGFSQPDGLWEGPLEVPDGPPAPHAIPHLRQVKLQHTLLFLKLPAVDWASGSLQHLEPFRCKKLHFAISHQCITIIELVSDLNPSLQDGQVS